MKISVIHPSRNRPERASKVYNQMISKADKPELIEYIISIDNDETKIIRISVAVYFLLLHLLAIIGIVSVL